MNHSMEYNLLEVLDQIVNDHVVINNDHQVIAKKRNAMIQDPFGLGLGFFTAFQSFVHGNMIFDYGNLVFVHSNLGFIYDNLVFVYTE